MAEIPKSGVKILPIKKPSPESVAARHNTLARISTPSERKIVEKAIEINRRSNAPR